MTHRGPFQTLLFCDSVILSPKSQILPIGSEAQFLLTSKAITDSSSGHPCHRIASRNNIYHPNPDWTTSLHLGLSTSIVITKGQSTSGSDHAFSPLNSSGREEYLLPMICCFLMDSLGGRDTNLPVSLPEDYWINKSSHTSF